MHIYIYIYREREMYTIYAHYTIERRTRNMYYVHYIIFRPHARGQRGAEELQRRAPGRAFRAGAQGRPVRGKRLHTIPLDVHWVVQMDSQ